MTESTGDPRPRLSKSLRYEILRRDNHTCRYCGASAPAVKLTVDHVMPVTLGGPTEPSNLVAACVDCNAGKKATPPGAPLVEDVQQSALRWKQAMEHMATLEAARRSDLLDTLSGLNWYWDRFTTVFADRKNARMDPDWEDSCEHWLNLGLTEDDIFYAMRKAMVKRSLLNSEVWRYTCGILWNTLTDRQEAARRMLDAKDRGL